MSIMSKTDSQKREDYEARVRELRHTMQDIVIAHAMICYKHMTPEQLESVREEWAQIVRGKGWASFFADDSAPIPAVGWQADTR